MSEHDHTGRILDDKYAVERLLGEGGMGAVYLGRHTGIGRPVAVKFLHAGFARNEEAVKRFNREARAAASIGHRNIIDVLDVGTTPEGDPYLVMEYLEGESLSGMLSRTVRVDLGTACAILEPVLRALAAAHEKGVVHRDLKPDNIFLVPRAGEAPEVKLIDFGVSKVESSPDRTRLTRDGSMLGTPAYMAPEQARGLADVDHRADLYSVGVILYEMLTGGLPFSGESFHDLLVNALTTEPRPPAELYPGFPEEASPMLDRALKKDPAERFQNASEMLEALRALAPSAERQEKLTRLGTAIRRSGSAVGDLGPAVGTVDLAAGAAGGLRGAGTGRRLLRYWPMAAAVAGLGLLTALARLCSAPTGPDGGVTITVRGAPEGAEIYYDDYLVPVNPFKVEKRETIAPIRVEARGYRKFKVSIVPSEDQVVEARLAPLNGAGAGKSAPDREDPGDRQKRSRRAKNPFKDFKWPWQK